MAFYCDENSSIASLPNQFWHLVYVNTNKLWLRKVGAQKIPGIFSPLMLANTIRKTTYVVHKDAVRLSCNYATILYIFWAPGSVVSNFLFIRPFLSVTLLLRYAQWWSLCIMLDIIVIQQLSAQLVLSELVGQVLVADVGSIILRGAPTLPA